METTNIEGVSSWAANRLLPCFRFKRFPAYGRRMMEQRIAGQVPREVVVAFDWNIGSCLPRIVIADAVSFDELEFRYLAGLDVTLAYREPDAGRVTKLAQSILEVNPRILNAFAVDIPKNVVLKSHAGQILL